MFNNDGIHSILPVDTALTLKYINYVKSTTIANQNLKSYYQLNEFKTPDVSSLKVLYNTYVRTLKAQDDYTEFLELNAYTYLFNNVLLNDARLKYISEEGSHNTELPILNPVFVDN